ncbi:hypothetical protein [Caulobacter sp. 17J65-9]|uniref:hypothetical protein n=1 Tax=Caulobacter sp. 17J65-9 TaxID=2709382 RepID=UPI0013C79010|nr:hypothetical protein [Caulobacter sp. 17J65-9]NEX91685.1 hypothetical protein [Caulobacter sp. 17J65-9]
MFGIYGFDIYGLVALTATFLGCGFALWKGGKFEQAGAVLTFFAQVGAVLAQQDTSRLAPKDVITLIDIALLIGFGVVAWKSTRSWPIFAAAFMMIKMTAHVTSWLNLEIGTFAYISALNIADYGVVTTLAIGTWNAWRERDALDFARR